MNQFTERYKSLSNTELLKIIENPDDYQPLSVEAAKAELDSRKLTDKELNAAKEELNIFQHEYEQKEQKKQDKIDRVKSAVKSAIENLNPIQKPPLKSDKLIKLISIVFAGIAVYQIKKEFGLLKFMFSGQGKWDFSMILYFLPLVLIPTASILFWTRKKIGWILLSIYLCYSALNSIGSIILTWNMKPTGNAALDSLFPIKSPSVYIFTSLFLLSTLWVINKKDLREIFQIDYKIMIRTIVASSLISILILFLNGTRF